ncbi:MAG: transglutaminaseTgpA domain-containing protein [Anaerolineae bacterium]|jgi:transglutaminase-like putative cysteine protease
MFRELEIREGWVTIALLLTILLCLSWSIQAAEWTSGLSILQPAILVGGVLGIVLAKSRSPNRLAHALSLVAGFAWSAYLTSRVISIDLGLSVEAAVLELEEMLREWVWVLFSGGTSAGNYEFLFLLTILLWLVAYVSAWAIFRWQRVWWSVIITGVALLINVTAAPNTLTGYVIAFVFFALLLVVRASLAEYEEEWRLAKVGYSPELIYGFLRAGLILTLVAILLAWAAPRAVASRPMQEVWNRISGPWRSIQDQSNRLFQDLNYRNEPAFVTFARSMRFGGAVQLTDAPVMDVESPQGRYWRVMVFHDYVSTGWNNTDNATINLNPNSDALVFPDLALRTEVTQTYTLRQNLGPQGTIAAAGQPLRSPLPLKAVISTFVLETDQAESSETTPAVPMPGDPSVLYSRQALEAGDSYQVVSSMTTVDAQSLREAGMDYPDWIVPRYLQLPDTLPERVTELASQITAERETPYEKAVAIEHYLRAIPYNEQIEAPPPGQDGVEYFLFDVREGYCDYYASAMVVMLRSVGVPARYVRGYGQGTKVEGVFRVLEENGHAWPEVFFPGYGWIEFEPTAGEPALTRSSGQDEDAGGAAGNRDRGNPYLEPDILEDDYFDRDFAGAWTVPTPEPFLQRLGRWSGWILVLAAIMLAVATVLLFRRRRRIEGLSVSERVYADLVNWVKRFLGIKPLAHQTPHEYAGAVAGAVPGGRESIERITELYVEERFGGKTVEDDEAEEAWRRAQPLLWRRWLRRLGERLGRFRYKVLREPRPDLTWKDPEQK